MTTPSDAPPAPKDAPPAPKPSADKPPVPSTTPEEKTLTKTEADKLANEKHSKLDTRIGILEKAAEASTKALTNEKARADAAEAANQKREDEAAKAEAAAIPPGNTDALTIWQAKETVREANRALDARDKTVTTREEAVTVAEAVNRGTLIRSLADDIVSKPEYAGVKAKDLVELTDGTQENMEKLAKTLVLTVTKPPVDPDTPPDGGQNSGNAGELTMEQREKMSVEEIAAHPSTQARLKLRKQ